jgi:hypothetical protein
MTAVVPDSELPQGRQLTAAVKPEPRKHYSIVGINYRDLRESAIDESQAFP